MFLSPLHRPCWPSINPKRGYQAPNCTYLLWQHTRSFCLPSAPTYCDPTTPIVILLRSFLIGYPFMQNCSRHPTVIAWIRTTRLMASMLSARQLRKLALVRFVDYYRSHTALAGEATLHLVSCHWLFNPPSHPPIEICHPRVGFVLGLCEQCRKLDTMLYFESDRTLTSQRLTPICHALMCAHAGACLWCIICLNSIALDDNIYEINTCKCR